MRRITESELLDLDFGSIVRIIWFNSPHRNEDDYDEEYYGVVFGEKIGWEDGEIDELRTIAEHAYNGHCMIYLIKR